MPIDLLSFQDKLLVKYSNYIIRKPVPLDERSRKIKDLRTIANEIESMYNCDDRAKCLMTGHMFLHNHPTMTLKQFFVDNGGHFKQSTHSQSDKLRQYETEFVDKLQDLFDSELAIESMNHTGISVQS
jgi:hypothetical protein